MQEKLLGDVIEKIIGKQAKETINLLIGKRDVNEFLLAKKMNLTINQVRNILYKLSNFGLVSFIRKKDKRKGWYTYFWTLETRKALELLEKNLSKEIEDMQTRLKNRETRRFYMCPVCKIETGEETALNNSFACPECGEVYQLNDNTVLIEDLKKRIERLARQKAEVTEEIIKVKEEEEKIAVKKRGKEKKKEKKVKGKKKDKEEKKTKKAEKKVKGKKKK